MNQSLSQAEANSPERASINSPEPGSISSPERVTFNSPEQLKANLPKPNQGLPELELGDRPYSYFEFWPAWFFYAPVVIYWLMLSIRYRNFGLPMTVNPAIPLGGMVGESKTAILDLAGKYAAQFILPYMKFTNTGNLSSESLLDQCKQNGLLLPLVVKPDLGCRGAGVRVVRSSSDLKNYLQEFPVDRDFLLQAMAPYTAEAGVFYVRRPNEAKGRVASLTLKYSPVVAGDGRRTLRELIEADERAGKVKHLYFSRHKADLDKVLEAGASVQLAFAGSHARGSIFRNGNTFITSDLEASIDRILKDFPDFHYGRLDIKFKDIESLKHGKDFVVIEVNGASSESTHIWDSRGSMREVFRTLFWQYRELFAMGDLMRKKGFKPPSARELVRTWIRELKQGKAYPSTD